MCKFFSVFYFYYDNNRSFEYANLGELGPCLNWDFGIHSLSVFSSKTIRSRFFQFHNKKLMKEKNRELKKNPEKVSPGALGGTT